MRSRLRSSSRSPLPSPLPSSLPARASLAGLSSAFLLLGAATASAANPEFQNFFFDACTSATGGLATRCGETTDGLGDLSSDSESSLNPSQVLNANAASAESVRARAKQARERAERLEEVESAGARGGPWHFIANVRVASDDLNRRVGLDPERASEQTVRAMEIGLDYRLSPNTLLGLLVSYEVSDLEFAGEAVGRNFAPARHAGRIETDRSGVTAYGAFQLSDRLYLDAALGYGSGDTEFSRNSVFQESNREVAQTNVGTRAEFDQTQWWGSVNLGYDVLQGAWNVTTYGGMQWSNTKSDGFTERDLTGSGLNMRFDSVDDKSLIGLLGVQVQRVFSLTTGVLVPQIRVEYLHEFDDDPSRAAARFAFDGADNRYTMTGNTPDSDYVAVGFGVGWVLPRGWIPFIDGEFLAGHDDRDFYRITAGLRKEL
jgi:outer membrane lipase/esterase